MLLWNKTPESLRAILHESFHPASDTSGFPVRLKIREIAEAKKINTSKLSRMADVNYNTIQAIWDNEMKDVTVSTLEKIVRALKVDVSELIEVLPDEEP